MVNAGKGKRKAIGEKGRKKRSRDWAKLYGLGKGLWNGEDTQVYIDRLREDRV